MALKIKQHEDLFLVEGTINSSTVKQFKNHLEFLLLYKKTLTINIERVKAIDYHGLNALDDIYAQAINYNKQFSIIGYGAKDLYDESPCPVAA